MNIKTINFDTSRLLNEYESGKTTRQLGKQYNLSYTTINRLLRKENCKFRDHKAIPKSFYNDILLEYQINRNAAQIAEKYDVSIQAIFYVLKSLNINTERKKFKVNSNYFESINSPDRAYWLGWMLSDGYVTRKNRVSLKITDREIVERFKNVLEYEGNIHTSYRNGWKDAYQVLINNTKMFNDLCRHQCIPNKTFLAEMPHIEDSLLPYFIRGFFEGDGCIYIKPKNNQAVFSIVGSKKILLPIKELIENKCNVNFQITQKKNDKLIQIECGGNKQVKRIRNYIYNESSVMENLHLERKYKKFLTIMPLSEANKLKQTNDAKTI